LTVPCKICNKRRARRDCPGLGAGICPQCCGEQRENTVDCPSSCEHLQAARHHEQPPPIPYTEVPNQDIQISDEFIRQHENVITWVTIALAASMERERAVDFDAREALDALIRTYRTLESGLIYQTKPQNPFAAAIQSALQKSVEELRQEVAKETGMHSVRDAEVLGTLVFLQRLELQHNNGRRRGRAFLDFLRAYFPAQPASQPIAAEAAAEGIKL
jgi:hypothetical protein